MTALERVVNKYNGQSFNISDFHSNNEFDKAVLKDFLEPALVHIHGRAKHVPPIERSVRTVKERSRSTCDGIPFSRITILMVRSLIEDVLDILNAFPSKNCISDTISPATIVERKSKLDFSKPKISFGSYAIAYTQTSNDMTTRAVPGIVLRTSNTARGHYLMSLYSGRIIHGYKWDKLPVDDYVIERVESLAEGEKQSLMHNGMLSFEWAPGIDVTDALEEE